MMQNRKKELLTSLGSVSTRVSNPLLALAYTHPDEQMRQTAWIYLEQLGDRTHDVALTSRPGTSVARQAREALDRPSKPESHP